jgi:glycosyltransferase involved in cell wall biosynthesis
MKISLVVPIYNEHDNLVLLYQAISQAMASLRHPWEVVLVDDGSRDDSLHSLEALALQESEHVRVVALRRSVGQTAAIAAGIDHASGAVLVMMDADLQNDPADIPLMVQKLEEGYAVVSGWRQHRKDTFLTRTLPSIIANRLISWVTGVRLHDYGCSLKAYRREVITGFRLYGEMHRFIPVYADQFGARMIEIPVNHHARRYGKAKYGLERTFKVILDLVTVKFLSSYGNKPIYLFGGTGVVLIAIALAVLLYLFIRRVFFLVSVFDSPLFQMSTTVLIMGFQSILMGLIAELLVRTYHESTGRVTYTVMKTINLPSLPAGEDTPRE